MSKENRRAFVVGLLCSALATSAVMTPAPYPVGGFAIVKTLGVVDGWLLKTCVGISFVMSDGTVEHAIQNDNPERYEELCKLWQERQHKRWQERQHERRHQI